jgi:hypothetical protein
MKKPIDPLLTVDSPDHLVRVLQSWRVWLAGALAGALLGWGVYALFLPPYRAQASVVVDYNVEELWISKLNTQYAFFYQRETRKLKEIAYSDETLGIVAEQVGDVSVEELRGGKLLLSYPYGGVWHFWAEDEDPTKAELLAKVWAETFLKRVHENVALAPEIDALRLELNAFVNENPGVDTGNPEVVRLMDEIAILSERMEGVSPYIDISLSQTESLPVTRTVDRSVYILVGSFVGAGLAAFLVLFTLKARREA